MELIQNEINVITNMRYLLEGYGLCSLERMVPADVPAVCIHGRVTKEMLSLLRQVMGKCCVIGVGEAAIVLLENQIKVDFIIFSEDTDYGRFMESSLWEGTSIIANARIPSFIFEGHRGKKFFYSSHNELEDYIFDGALKRSKGIYRYNHLIEIGDLGAFLGDSYAILLEENEEGDSIAEIYEKSVPIGRFDIPNAALERYFSVEVDMDRIESWLIPLFDEAAREYFVTSYNRFLLELSQLKDIVEQNIGLYEELYEVAKKDIVEKSELDRIIGRLSTNNACLEETEYLPYLVNLSEQIDYSGVEREKKNEVEAIAMEGIDSFQRIKMVLEKLMMTILPIEKTDIDIKKTDCARCLREEDEVDNILLVVGISQYNVLPYFMNGLKEGFQRLNVVTYTCVIDIRCFESGYNHFQNTVGYQYVLLLNGMGVCEQRHGPIQNIAKSMFDNSNSRLLPMYVDHPYWHSNRLSTAYTAYAVLFADGNWTQYAKKYLKNVPKPVFFPLGGLEQQGVEKINFLDRANKAVFFGSYSDIKKQEEEINAHEYSGVIKRIIEILKNNTDMTIEEAVDKVEEENRTSYTVHNIVFHTDVFGIIDTYLRQFYRYKVIDTIIRAGIPIDIYGWKGASYENYPNVTLKEAVTFDEMLAICQHTRFVVNIQPWLKSGTQERVFNAMLSGAVAVTDETQYLREKTSDRENILLYNLKEIESLPAKIRYYMEHEDEAGKIAKNGYELARAHHTWGCRAAEIRDLLEQRRDVHADC